MNQGNNNQGFLQQIAGEMLNESKWYYGARTNGHLINESILEDGERSLRTPNEFIDLMSDMTGGNKWVGFGYISGANLNIPKTKRINPETGRMKGYEDYGEMGKQLGYNDGIGGIIKFTRLLVNFQTNDEIGKQYSQYKDQVADIRNQFGVPEIKDKQGYTDKIDYGQNGLKTYSGDNQDKQGRLYTDQNVYSAYNQTDGNIKRKMTAYYIIGPDGKIMEECTKEKVTEIFDKFGKPSQYGGEVGQMLNNVGGYDSGLNALKKIEADDKTMMEYLRKINDLKFIYRRFEFSSIVYMVGTCNGERFYYINNNLTKIPSGVGVDIDPSQFIQIANNKYRKTLDEIGQMGIDDMSNRNIM